MFSFSTFITDLFRLAFYLFFVFSISSIYSQSTPAFSPQKDPFPKTKKKITTDSATPSSSPKKGNTLTLKNSASQSQTNFTKQTQILLGDGRSVKGTIRIKVPDTIDIQHTKDGIQYTKSIQMEEVTSIELKNWKGKFIKRKSQGTIYSFEVVRYIIHLNGGQTLLRIGYFLPFLREIVLTNSNGNVRLYSYWLDLYLKKGTWHTGQKGAPNTEWNVSHSDVIKKIIFL